MQTLTSSQNASPKMGQLSEQSRAARLDDALKLLPSEREARELRHSIAEHEALLRKRIASLEAEVAKLHASRPVAELSPRRGWCYKYNSLAGTLGWLGDTGAIARWERRFFVLAQGECGGMFNTAVSRAPFRTLAEGTRGRGVSLREAAMQPLALGQGARCAPPWPMPCRRGVELRYFRGDTDGTPRRVIQLADVVLVD